MRGSKGGEFDNGSGKSTLIEAIAVVAGFNPEGAAGKSDSKPKHPTRIWPTISSCSRATVFSRAGSSEPRPPTTSPPSATTARASVHRWGLITRSPTASCSSRSPPSGSTRQSCSSSTSPRSRCHSGASSRSRPLSSMASRLEPSSSSPRTHLRSWRPWCRDFGTQPLRPRSHSYDDLEIVGLWRSFLDAPRRFLRHLDTAT